MERGNGDTKGDLNSL